MRPSLLAANQSMTPCTDSSTSLPTSDRRKGSIDRDGLRTLDATPMTDLPFGSYAHGTPATSESRRPFTPMED